MIILSSRLLKKYLNRKSKLVQLIQGSTGKMAFKHSILLNSFVTNLAANIGCYQFRIMPEIVSKLSSLCTTIWSCCAVWLESEQTPFSRTGSSCLFRSAALHRFRFGTSWFVLCPIFTRDQCCEGLKDWEKQLRAIAGWQAGVWT